MGVFPALARRDSLPAVAAHHPGCGVPVRASRRGWKRALALVLVHVLVLVHIAHWKITGRSLSPLEPSEAGETLTLGYVNAGFVLLVVLLCATLVVGRFFCGWACHVVAYQDACAWLLGRLGLRPKPVRSRLLAFVPLLAAFEMFVLPSWLRWWSGAGLPSFGLALQTDDLWARFPGPLMAATTLLVDGGLVVWLLGAKGFCTYGCPYGALFGLVERGAKGRIRVSDACEACGHCTSVCTSNVRVHEEVARFGMVVDPGCMKCMDCVSVCPKGALSFGFGRVPGRAEAPRRAWDFTWPEEIALALVFVAALYAFRNLYGAVPFLLAIGLAVIAAISALVLWRLLTRASFALQHLWLKQERRFSGAGVVACVALPAFLAFTLHSISVQRDARAGRAHVARAAGLARGTPERRAELEAASHRLSRTLAVGLVAVVELENMLGQVLFELGDLAGAEEHLGRAAELDPHNASARVVLAETRLLRRDVQGAAAALREVLERQPEQRQARAALERALTAFPDANELRSIASELRAIAEGLSADRADPGAAR